jgi:predicted nucleic acid-binding protein
MSGRYLLDTNIIIALFADEVAVKNRLAQADEVFIPSIPVGTCYAEIVWVTVAPYSNSNNGASVLYSWQ